MKHDNESSADPDYDPLIRNAYRTHATETVPAHLDRTILNDARRANTAGPSTPWLFAWLGPVAFVAIAALSVTVVLEFGNRASTAVPQDESRDVRTDSKPVSPGAAGDLAAAVESTGIRLRELDSAAERLVPANRPVTGSVSGATASETAAADGTSKPSYCDASMTLSAEKWWSCIEKLQENGQLDAARSELELLRSAFPEFETRK